MENIKNKGGRPVKWTEKKSLELADELIKWLSKEDNIWINTFLAEKGLYPQITSELAEKYPKFSEALKRAKGLQEGKVVKNALTNMYNSTFSIFLLKNNFGWKDKVEQEITHNIEQPLFPDPAKKENKD